MNCCCQQHAGVEGDRRHAMPCHALPTATGHQLCPGKPTPASLSFFRVKGAKHRGPNDSRVSQRTATALQSGLRQVNGCLLLFYPSGSRERQGRRGLRSRSSPRAAGRSLPPPPPLGTLPQRPSGKLLHRPASVTVFIPGSAAVFCTKAPSPSPRSCWGTAGPAPRSLPDAACHTETSSPEAGGAPAEETRKKSQNFQFRSARSSPRGRRQREPPGSSPSPSTPQPFRRQRRNFGLQEAETLMCTLQPSRSASR